MTRSEWLKTHTHERLEVGESMRVNRDSTLV